MATHLFTGNVIAVIWDFDQTLIPGYQQEPLFEEYGIESSEFWAEVKALADHFAQIGIKVSPDTAYLNHLLTYVKTGRLAGLTNSKLKQLGAKLKFYEGIPDFLRTASESIETQSEFKNHGISVEHYVVSTGLRQMILGSGVAKFITDVWACEFIEKAPEPGFLSKDSVDVSGDEREITQIGYFLDNTTKTRAIWEINKGTNRDPKIDVNALIDPTDRRVPLRNMVYIADGPSDIPVFSILNTYGGRTLGVYNPAQNDHFDAVKRLSDQGRVHFVAEADYTTDSTASKWILKTMKEIGELIVLDRERALVDRVQPPSGHVV